jgi:hypothetical protein
MAIIMKFKLTMVTGLFESGLPIAVLTIAWVETRRTPGRLLDIHRLLIETGKIKAIAVKVYNGLIVNRRVAMARIGAQTVSGNNLAGLVAEVAARYQALREPRIDTGACRCRGGNGNCPGCDSKPVYRDFKRVAGLRGDKGVPGTVVTESLHKGTVGLSGKIIYTVHRGDGTRQEYDTRYMLEVIDFDLEDENGDGVFEPGEHLFIKRIQVRNCGKLVATN